ncbi:MAG TPA: YdeI/OmpD-associated family protein [Verrucomicrobiae bacterium]
MKILSFQSPLDFRNWLEKNHAASDGISLRIFKKGSGEKSITYAEALDQSLCYGWIDGQKQAHDKHSWLQKFAPRRAKSGWSKVNTQNVERLVKTGQMTPAGLKEIESAQADGRWKAAYDSSRNAAPPKDFLRALDSNKKAKAFFETLNKANIYSIVYRLQTAKKPETREKRMKLILGMLTRGEAFHQKT